MRFLTVLGIFILCFYTVACGYSRYCSLRCPLFNPPSYRIHLPGPTVRHFYKCDNGAAILFMCPPRTHFNPRIQVCDWPRRARAVACRGVPNAMGESSGDGPDYVPNMYH